MFLWLSGPMDAVRHSRSLFPSLPNYLRGEHRGFSGKGQHRSSKTTQNRGFCQKKAQNLSLRENTPKEAPILATGLVQDQLDTRRKRQEKLSRFRYFSVQTDHCSSHKGQKEAPQAPSSPPTMPPPRGVPVNEQSYRPNTREM